MSPRFASLVSALALVALAVTIGALVTLAIRPQTTAAAQNFTSVRQITVVGQGEAKAAPDTTIVQLGVQTDAASAQQALSDNSSRMQALIAKLKELGVADKDMQTSNVSINPRYNNDGKTVEGYQANNSLTVTIRNISQTGALLDQVVAAGANSIGGIGFTINDPSAIQQQARDKAIADARTRANAMAKAAGGTVGQVLAISENIGSAPPVMYRAEMPAANAAVADSVPVQQGEQTINAQVQISFELK